MRFHLHLPARAVGPPLRLPVVSHVELPDATATFPAEHQSVALHRPGHVEDWSGAPVLDLEQIGEVRVDGQCHLALHGASTRVPHRHGLRHAVEQLAASDDEKVAVRAGVGRHPADERALVGDVHVNDERFSAAVVHAQAP